LLQVFVTSGTPSLAVFLFLCTWDRLHCNLSSKSCIVQWPQD
jgi:hypothetical protein